MVLLVIYLLQIKKTLLGVYLQKRVISQNQLAAGQWIRPSCPEGSNLMSKSSWWKVDWGNKWGTVSCFLMKFCVLVQGANDKWAWGSSLVQLLCSRLLSILFSCFYCPDFIAFSGWTQVSESGGVRRGIEDSSCFPGTIYHNTSLNFSFLKQTWKKSQRGKKALWRKELQAQMPFPFISAVQILNAKCPWSSCSAAFNKDLLVVTTRSSTSLPKKVKRRDAWKPGISKCWLCGLGSITGWTEKKEETIQNYESKTSLTSFKSPPRRPLRVMYTLHSSPEDFFLNIFIFVAFICSRMTSCATNIGYENF